MNLEPDNPEIPRDKPSRKPERSFEQVLAALKPPLDKLPLAQRLPSLPQSEEMLADVQEYVRELGMSVPPVPPPAIAIGGEFLDPLRLKEGRVGLHRKQRVAAFLYRYPDKVLRAVILFPRDEVDIRKIALAIMWAQVADVPESIVQTEIVSVADFFAICAFDLSRMIDVPALERFKAEYRQKLSEELEAARRLHVGAEKMVEALRSKLSELERRCGEYHGQAVREGNRADGWKMVAWAAIALLPLAAVLARWLGG